MTTTTPPISVPLYSVREASLENFDQVLELIAKIGFKALSLSIYLVKAQPSSKTGERFRHGSIVYSLSLGDSQPGHLASCRYRKNLGLTRAPTSGFGPDDFKDMDAIKRTIDTTKSHRRAQTLRSNPVPAQSSLGIRAY